MQNQLETSLKNKTTALQKAQQEVSSLRTAAQKTEQQFTQLQTTMRKYIATQKKKVAMLEQEREAVKGREKEMERRYETMNAELGVAKELAKEQKEVKLSGGAVLEVEQVERMMMDLEVAAKEKEKLVGMVRAVKKEKNDLAKVFMNLKKKYGEVVQASASKAELVQSQERVGELEGKCKKLRDVLARANDRIQQNKVQMKQTGEHMVVLESKLMKLEGEAGVAGEQHQAKLRDLEGVLEKMEKERELMKEEKKKVEEEFNNYRVKATTALQQNAGELGRVDEYVNTISSLRVEVAQLKQADLRLKEKIIELQATQNSSPSLKEEVEDLQNENAELQSQVFYLFYFILFFFLLFNII